MLRYSMLSYDMLYNAMQHYAVLCYILLRCPMLCFVCMERCAVLCYSVFCYTVLCYALCVWNAVLCYAVFLSKGQVNQTVCGVFVCFGLLNY